MAIAHYNSNYKLYTVRNTQNMSVESSMAYLSPINMNISKKNNGKKLLGTKPPKLTETLGTFRSTFYQSNQKVKKLALHE